MAFTNDSYSVGRADSASGSFGIGREPEASTQTGVLCLFRPCDGSPLRPYFGWPGAPPDKLLTSSSGWFQGFEVVSASGIDKSLLSTSEDRRRRFSGILDWGWSAFPDCTVADFGVDVITVVGGVVFTFVFTLKPLCSYVAFLWAADCTGGETVADGVTPALAPSSRSVIDSSWFSSSGTASLATTGGLGLPDLGGDRRLCFRWSNTFHWHAG